jgi:hypothetical protein
LDNDILYDKKENDMDIKNEIDMKLMISFYKEMKGNKKHKNIIFIEDSQKKIL